MTEDRTPPSTVVDARAFARATFLASLEYGVNPLVGRDTTNDREGTNR